MPSSPPHPRSPRREKTSPIHIPTSYFMDYDEIPYDELRSADTSAADTFAATSEDGNASASGADFAAVVAAAERYRDQLRASGTMDSSSSSSSSSSSDSDDDGSLQSTYEKVDDIAAAHHRSPFESECSSAGAAGSDRPLLGGSGSGYDMAAMTVPSSPVPASSSSSDAAVANFSSSDAVVADPASFDAAVADPSSPAATASSVASPAATASSVAASDDRGPFFPDIPGVTSATSEISAVSEAPFDEAHAVRMRRRIHRLGLLPVDPPAVAVAPPPASALPSASALPRWARVCEASGDTLLLSAANLALPTGSSDTSDSSYSSSVPAPDAAEIDGSGRRSPVVLADYTLAPPDAGAVVADFSGLSANTEEDVEAEADSEDEEEEVVPYHVQEDEEDEEWVVAPPSEKDESAESDALTAITEVPSSVMSSVITLDVVTEETSQDASVVTQEASVVAEETSADGCAGAEEASDGGGARDDAASEKQDEKRMKETAEDTADSAKGKDIGEDAKDVPSNIVETVDFNCVAEKLKVAEKQEQEEIKEEEETGEETMEKTKEEAGECNPTAEPTLEKECNAAGFNNFTAALTTVDHKEPAAGVSDAGPAGGHVAAGAGAACAPAEEVAAVEPDPAAAVFFHNDVGVDVATAGSGDPPAAGAAVAETEVEETAAEEPASNAAVFFGAKAGADATCAPAEEFTAVEPESAAAVFFHNNVGVDVATEGSGDPPAEGAAVMETEVEETAAEEPASNAAVFFGTNAGVDVATEVLEVDDANSLVEETAALVEEQAENKGREELVSAVVVADGSTGGDVVAGGSGADDADPPVKEGVTPKRKFVEEPATASAWSAGDVVREPTTTKRKYAQEPAAAVGGPAEADLVEESARVKGTDGEEPAAAVAAAGPAEGDATAEETGAEAAAPPAEATVAVEEGEDFAEGRDPPVKEITAAEAEGEGKDVEGPVAAVADVTPLDGVDAFIEEGGGAEEGGHADGTGDKTAPAAAFDAVGANPSDEGSVEDDTEETDGTAFEAAVIATFRALVNEFPTDAAAATDGEKEEENERCAAEEPAPGKGDDGDHTIESLAKEADAVIGILSYEAVAANAIADMAGQVEEDKERTGDNDTNAADDVDPSAERPVRGTPIADMEALFAATIDAVDAKLTMDTVDTNISQEDGKDGSLPDRGVPAEGDELRKDTDEDVAKKDAGGAEDAAKKDVTGEEDADDGTRRPLLTLPSLPSLPSLPERSASELSGGATVPDAVLRDGAALGLNLSGSSTKLDFAPPAPLERIGDSASWTGDGAVKEEEEETSVASSGADAVQDGGATVPDAVLRDGEAIGLNLRDSSTKLGLAPPLERIGDSVSRTGDGAEKEEEEEASVASSGADAVQDGRNVSGEGMLASPTDEKDAAEEPSDGNATSTPRDISFLSAIISKEEAPATPLTPATPSLGIAPPPAIQRNGDAVPWTGDIAKKDDSEEAARVSPGTNVSLPDETPATPGVDVPSPVEEAPATPRADVPSPGEDEDPPTPGADVPLPDPLPDEEASVDLNGDTGPAPVPDLKETTSSDSAEEPPIEPIKSAVSVNEDDLPRPVRFRDPFPPPKPPPLPRSSAVLAAKRYTRAPPVRFDPVTPSSKLSMIVEGLRSLNVGRRAHACGALKLLCAPPVNRRRLVRTKGLLDALLLSATRQKHFEPSFVTDGRVRCAQALLYLSASGRCRGVLLGHPGAVKGLCNIAHAGAGEAAAAAVTCLRQLCREDRAREGLCGDPAVLALLGRLIGVGRKGEEEQVRVRNKLAANARHDAVNPRLQGLENHVAKVSCSILVVLAQYCPNSPTMANSPALLGALCACAADPRSPIVVRTLEVIANLTRLPGNAPALLNNSPTLLDVLVDRGTSGIPDARRWAGCAVMNLSAHQGTGGKLVEPKVLAMLSQCLLSEKSEERFSAAATLLNLANDPGNVVPVANAPDVLAGLIHVAQAGDTPPGVRVLAYDVIATIGQWLQGIAGTCRVPAEAKSDLLPSGVSSGWLRWDS